MLARSTVQTVPMQIQTANRGRIRKGTVHCAVCLDQMERWGSLQNARKTPIWSKEVKVETAQMEIIQLAIQPASEAPQWRD